MNWEACAGEGGKAQLIQTMEGAWRQAIAADPRAAKHAAAVFSAARTGWPRPCYPGASYLNCGWSWLYECQAYPDTGSEACWEVGVDRYPTRYRAEVQHTWEEWWPHLC